MGAKLSRSFGKVFGNRPLRALMLGLDSAGKTTILYKMKLSNRASTTIPTVGFNVESVSYKNVRFNIWDVGGQDKIRPLWRHYYSGTQALLFVVDSTDHDRIDEAAVELMTVLSDKEMADVVLLVFANKSDLSNRLSVEEITKRLGLNKLHADWHVQPACATTGDGLLEGLAWLNDALARKRRG